MTRPLSFVHDQAVPPARLAGDQTLALWRDPYRFIGRHCAALGAPVFETRLMLQRTVCMSGAEAARLFYDERGLRRAGAAPEPLRATLFGKGGVQGLDGAGHRRRKALFLQITQPAEVQRLVGMVRRAWERALPEWSRSGPFPLYRAVQPVLAEAVCQWAGVPLAVHERALRTRHLVALFDSAAAGIGPHFRSRAARWHTEQWLACCIDHLRAEPARAAATPGAASLFAQACDPKGRPMPTAVAAVELANVLRPTVAVSVYIAHLAQALHAHPAWAGALAQGGVPGEALAFVQEVRRLSPFFPAVIARVHAPFSWQGVAFPRGRRVLLDLYGTNRDPAAWREPDRFLPERWRDHRPAPFQFVPQGGGDAATQHRCPGEDVAVQLMLLALQMLLQRMRYRVADDADQLDLQRLPALPARGFVVSDVQALNVA